MQCTLPCPGRRFYLRMLVLLMVLVMTSRELAPARGILWMKSSMPFSQNLYTSKRRSLKFLLSRDGCPVWIHISRKHLGILRLDLQRWNRISVLSPQVVCASSRYIPLQHQMYPVRRDLGLRSNKLTAPQPQGPMAQDHLMTTETRDEDFILPHAPKTNNHEVPSYSDSLVNNISKELHSGSIPFGMDQTCKLATNLSEFTARQVPCEANIRTLLLEKG